MRVQPIAFHQSKQWLIDGDRLRNRGGGFFSVIGARLVDHRTQRVLLHQPLIDQPEVGILGFALRQRGGTRELLVQAKAEPGNVGLLQAAPTVQATQSNYLRRHRGKKTLFLEWFREPRTVRIISDSLQSEQGTRFMGKYNRNMIVEVPARACAATPPMFEWFAARDVLAMLTHDFQINTDARSVLACSRWDDLIDGGEPFARWRGGGTFGERLLHSYRAQVSSTAIDQVLNRLKDLQRRCAMRTHVVGLHALQGWAIDDCVMRSLDGDSFEVRQFEIESAQREVPQWDQPLITSSHMGEIVLLCQVVDGALRFLFQARTEIGFRERVQFGPSVQWSPDVCDLENPLDRQLRTTLDRAREIAACMQSDEGGRFFRCVSRYRLCQVPDDEVIEPHERLAWMTLGEVEQLIARPGVFTNEARSAISMLLAFA